jgi:thioredoxin-like negative regulator of GroEL
MAPPKIDRSDQLPPAVEPLEAEVARNPGDAAPRRRLGWALYAAGKPTEALAIFRRACADFPDDVDLLFGRALTAKEVGAGEEAAEAFLGVARMAEAIPDAGRAEILHRLATAHHNRLRTGRWGLEREIWGRP